VVDGCDACGSVDAQLPRERHARGAACGCGRALRLRSAGARPVRQPVQPRGGLGAAPPSLSTSPPLHLSTSPPLHLRPSVRTPVRLALSAKQTTIRRHTPRTTARSGNAPSDDASSSCPLRNPPPHQRARGVGWGQVELFELHPNTRGRAEAWGDYTVSSTGHGTYRVSAAMTQARPSAWSFAVNGQVPPALLPAALAARSAGGLSVSLHVRFILFTCVCVGF